MNQPSTMKKPVEQSENEKALEGVGQREDTKYSAAEEIVDDMDLKAMKAFQTKGDQPAEESASKAVEFNIFQHLPQEMQDAIWKTAISEIEPRVVEIRDGHYYKVVDYLAPPKPLYRFKSPCPIPTLLHTCRDSRRLALKRWKLCFPWLDYPARIFFDLKSDTLFIGRGFYSIASFIVESNKADREGVRKIAFSMIQQSGMKFVNYGICGKHIAMRLRKNFPALDDISFVTYKSDQDTAYNSDHHEIGRAQNWSDPRNTIITFGLTLRGPIRRAPILRYMYPVKPSGDIDFKAFMEYIKEIKVCEVSGGALYGDEDSHHGMWLDELKLWESGIVLAAILKAPARIGN